MNNLNVEIDLAQPNDPWQMKRTLFIILAAALVILTMVQQIGIINELSWFLSVHTLLENLSVLFSLMIFILGWHVYTTSGEGNLILFACLFLAVGLLDFAHALSYQGMPDLFTPNTTHKELIFWLSARWASAISFLCITLLPWTPFKKIYTRYLVLGGCLVFTAIVYWIGFLHPEYVPMTFIEGQGLTPFKIAMEYAVMVIYLVTLLLILFRPRQTGSYETTNLITALIIMLLSEFSFTFYVKVTDDANLLGHIYKDMALIFVYKAMFENNIHIPFIRLLKSEHLLRRSRGKLFTTLKSIQDAVIIADTSGTVLFMNPAASHLTAYPGDEGTKQKVDRIFQVEQINELIAKNKKAADESITIQTLLHRHDGTQLAIEFSLSPIVSEISDWLGTVIVFRDITERRKSEEIQKRLTSILEAASDFIATVDVTGHVLYFNRSAMDLLGVGKETDIRKIHLTSAHPAWANRLVLREGLPFATKNGVWIGETALLDKWGEEIPISQAIIAHKNEAGEVEFFSMIGRNINDIKKAEERQRFTSHLFENISEGILVTDLDQNIIFVNAAFTRVTGYTEDEVIGKKPNILSSGLHNRAFYENMWFHIEENGRWQGEVWNKHKNGEVYLEEITIGTVKNASREITHYVAVLNDITERKQLEAKLQFQVLHDPVTGLPNRTMLQEHFDLSVRHANKSSRLLGMLFIDLDRFKRINATLGHSTGDLLLKELADRFIAGIRPGDIVARLGGDEFIILLPKLLDENYSTRMAADIIKLISAPFMIDGQELYVTASVGISFYPRNGTNLITLIKHADEAMNRAKELGGNCFQIYKPHIKDEAFDILSLENSLRKALESGQFVLHYQPKLDVRDKTVIGMEALIRWIHPTMGIIPPVQFIPVAETAGLILAIDEWVLKQACIQAKEWQNQGLPPLRVSVNLSMLQFQQDNLLQTIKDILTETALDPQYLELEITESMMMEDPEMTLLTIQRIKQIGIHISVDDFGTGYSSLNYLKKLPIDTVKIDKSFINDITVDNGDKAIVGAIISLAHSLDMIVIAEGVETLEQFDYLAENQCDQIQGYFLGCPMTPNDFAEFIGRQFLSSPTI